MIAEQAGADRVELNCAVELGGLTPSLGCVEQVMQRISIPVIAMARPRASGFCYSDREFATLMRDAELMLAAGVHGIAFGVLDQQRRVDVARCRHMVEMIGSRAAVFHRAFDLVEDWQRELEVLVDCGVTRIMTSGQQPTAVQAIGVLQQLVRKAGDRIQLIAAGGIRSPHVARLVESGIRQIHAGPHRWCLDTSQPPQGRVSFYGDPPLPDQYRQVSGEEVEKLAQQLPGWAARHGQ